MPISGRVTSYFLIGANVGSMLLPWGVGQLFESVGPEALIMMLALAMGLALMLFLGITRYSRRFE